MPDTGAGRGGDTGISMQKLGLFLFLLIYVTTVSLVTYVFSPALNPTMMTSDLNVKDPGTIGGITPATGVTFLSVLFGIVSSMFQMMTFQVPLVPPLIQFILAIPMFIFIIVLADMIIDVANLLINVFNAVTKWL
jgi:hypothetical protein